MIFSITYIVLLGAIVFSLWYESNRQKVVQSGHFDFSPSSPTGSSELEILRAREITQLRNDLEDVTDLLCEAVIALRGLRPESAAKEESTPLDEVRGRLLSLIQSRTRTQKRSFGRVYLGHLKLTDSVGSGVPSDIEHEHGLPVHLGGIQKVHWSPPSFVGDPAAHMGLTVRLPENLYYKIQDKLSISDDNKHIIHKKFIYRPKKDNLGERTIELLSNDALASEGKVGNKSKA